MDLGEKRAGPGLDLFPEQSADIEIGFPAMAAGIAKVLVSQENP